MKENRAIQATLDKLEQELASLWEPLSRTVDSLTRELMSARDRSDSLAVNPSPGAIEEVSRSVVNSLNSGLDRLSQFSVAVRTRIERIEEQLRSLRARGRELESQEEVYSQLYQVARLVTSELDLQKLLDLIMDSVLQITGAERGFLILPDETGSLDFRIAHNISKEVVHNPDFQVSHTIITNAFKEGTPLLVNDAREDERFRGSESILRLDLRSILCIPLKRGDETTGLLYLENRKAGGLFTQSDLNQLLGLAEPLAIGIGNARIVASLRKSQETLLGEIRRLQGFEGIVTRSPKMEELLTLARRVIDGETTVLVEGESGTGKELLAKMLHLGSRRKDWPFKSINFGLVSGDTVRSELFGHRKGAFTDAREDKPGLVEEAEGGTVFFDDIHNLDRKLMPLLLEFLERKAFRRLGENRDRQADVRIVLATNKSLEEVGFPEELLYRINTFTLQLPPLRERKEDIGPLALFFLSRYNQRMERTVKGISSEAMAILEAHDWRKNNIRELRNVVERAVILTDDGQKIEPESLPREIKGEAEKEIVPHASRESRQKILQDVETKMIVEALRSHGGNVARAASSLGLTPQGLRYKMKRLGISK